MKRLASLRSSGPHDRDIVDDQRVKILGDGQEIRGAERLLAQVGIVEPRDVARRLRHGDLAPEQGQPDRLALFDAGQSLEGLVRAAWAASSAGVR